jgi:hypothetical protein
MSTRYVYPNPEKMYCGERKMELSLWIERKLSRLGGGKAKIKSSFSFSSLF